MPALSIATSMARLSLFAFGLALTSLAAPLSSSPAPSFSLSSATGSATLGQFAPPVIVVPITSAPIATSTSSSSAAPLPTQVFGPRVVYSNALDHLNGTVAIDTSDIAEHAGTHLLGAVFVVAGSAVALVGARTGCTVRQLSLRPA